VGNGIAQVCAMAGYATALRSARSTRTRTRDRGGAGAAGAQAAVFGELDRLAPAHAVLATNTSSLSVSRIAEATGRPDRVVGLHFFNPVHLMKLLEVVRGRGTSEEALDEAPRLRAPDRQGADRGHRHPRLRLVPAGRGARAGGDADGGAGVASPADIDRAMELGYNHPMGPLRLTDLVGLDVRLGIAEYLHATLGGEQYRPPEILRRMVAEGRLGKKSGRGFYDWEGG
jgi:3-hydroxybutyryl-CoA dehydrogenase